MRVTCQRNLAWLVLGFVLCRFRCEELCCDRKDQLSLETIRLKSFERVERLLWAWWWPPERVCKKVCKDPISLAWMTYRVLHMPPFLNPRLIRKALLICSWSLHYESE